MDEDDDDEANKGQGIGDGYIDADDFEANSSQVPRRGELVNGPGDAHQE